MGLQCVDVKVIHKRENINEVILYIVYFKHKSITMNDLRKDHTRVIWDFQKSKNNKITQCFNCQMFGHGSSRCKVKTFCAICAGNHKTTECKSNNIKCANCSGERKAMSPDCPSRQNYVEIKAKLSNSKKATRPQYSNARNYATNFPNTLNQNHSPTTNWKYQNEIPHGNLFSIEELISKLRSCQSKMDQFEVISSIAFKFLA